MGLLGGLKCWTADLEVPGSGPTGQQGFFPFRIHSALTQEIEKKYTVEPLYNGHFGTSHFWVIFAVIEVFLFQR